MATIPAVGFAKPATHGKLTAIITTYRDRADRLARGPSVDDDAVDAAVDAMDEILESMIGVPVRSRAEAVLAIARRGLRLAA